MVEPTKPLDSLPPSERPVGAQASTEPPSPEQPAAPSASGEPPFDPPPEQPPSKRPPPEFRPPGGPWTVQKIMFWIVFIALVGILTAIFFDVPVIKRLSDTGFARGLITFIISLATIGLAFILVSQSFSNQTTDEGFRRAREVFAGLMGVLGTIVGFYFGSAEKPITALDIATLKAAEKQLVTFASGGARPYQYVITSTEKDFKVINGSSEDGWIVAVLEQAPKAGSKVTVTVTDNKQQKEFRSIDFPAEMGLQAPALPPKPPG